MYDNCHYLMKSIYKSKCRRNGENKDFFNCSLNYRLRINMKKTFLCSEIKKNLHKYTDLLMGTQLAATLLLKKPTIVY